MNNMFSFMAEAKPELSPLEQTSSEIIQEAQARLEDPRLLETILDDLHSIGIAGEDTLSLTLYLVMTSRLLERPLAAIVQGPSSSGKSYILEKIGFLCPPESLLLATDITPNALYLMKPGELVHRFVVAGERTHKQNGESAHATKALREMLSSGYLNKLMPYRNPETGKMESELIEQPGPIAFVESTTLTKLFDEDVNRCLLLQTDERSEQTLKIMEYGAMRAARQTDKAERKQIQLIQHTMQRLLQSVDIEIPYALALQQVFPFERVETRRIFEQVLNVIRAIALLYQYQRPVDANGVIQAQLEDYEIARKLLHKPIARSLGGALSDAAINFYDRFQQLEDGEYTSQQIAKLLRIHERTVRNHLRALEDVEAVSQTEASRGKKAAKWRVIRNVNIDEGTGNPLPAIEQVFGMSEIAGNLGDSDESEVPF